MMSASKNMELISFGSYLLNSFSAYLLRLKSKTKFSACTEGFHLKLILLIKLEISIDSKIYLIMVHYVIFYGQTRLMTAKMDSTHHLEALDTAGDKISVINLCIETTLKWCAGHISL